MTGPTHILVVDDDAEVARGTSRLLERAGYTVATALSAAEALASLAATRTDLVLLDRHLPDLDGVEVCRQIKANPACTGLFVIFVSARYTLSEEQSAGLESGADGYIARPISNRELLARVEAFVRLHALTRSLQEKAAELETANAHLRQQEAAAMALRHEALAARNRAESALTAWRDSENLHRTVIEVMREGLLVQDQQNRIVMANASAARILGLPVTELLGQEAFAPRWQAAREDGSPLRLEDRPCAITVRSGKPVDHQVMQIQNGAGKRVLLSVSSRAILSTEGQVTGVVASFADITDQRRLEAQCLRAQRIESIGTLASGIAHDLNNILAPIMMSVPLLRGPLAPAEFDSALAGIESNARRGADIIQQLLCFGRGLPGERAAVQLRHAVRDVLRMAQETFPRNLTISHALAADLWPVLGDATQIHQVLLNLCINARDAMPQGGTLSVKAANVSVDEPFARANPEAKPGPYVRLEIQDTGLGIPGENLERIFDPFFTTKAPGQGTGLGLSTVLGIVKSHGGFIQVQSRPGEGAAFVVYLPAWVGASPPAVAAVPAPPPLGRGELILVVDDEPHIRETVRKVLEKKGYQVLVAADGRAATNLCVEHRETIQLVLTDLMMPQMDGATLAGVLKRLNPSLEIAISSGLMGGLDDAAREALRALGVTHFLAKPYSIETLLATVHEILHPPAVNPDSAGPR